MVEIYWINLTLHINVRPWQHQNKMKTTSSESKGKLKRSRKGLVNALAFKTKVRLPKYKKARYAIGNVSEKDLSKIIKEFEKIGRLPYEKSIFKHEPTPSYFRLVRQLAKCMMRYDQINRHGHSSYAEKIAPSSNVNVTDEDESKEIILHENLLENKSKDLSKSECNIVHETLSQNNSEDVPDNVIMELKDDEHKEPSLTEKVTSYFNIFECGRNLLGRLDFMYQRSFVATSAQDEYYKEMTKIPIKANIGSDGKIFNEKIQQAVIDLRAELNLEHKRNINNITCEDEYTSPMKKKEAKTINDSVYYESYEHADTISDSSKQVDGSKKPITDTQIVEGINNLSFGIVSVEPAVIGVGIIGQDITHGVMSMRTNIGSNTVTDILTNSSKQLFKTNTFQLNSLQSETLVIEPQD